jgi:hypothetical protein
MNLSHARCELQRKVAATQMDIEQSGLYAAVSCECSDLMNVPACMRQVGQTEMTKCVR